MASVPYGEVGYINPNGLINMGLTSRQPPGSQWWFVMHCEACHENCGAFASVVMSRRCPSGCRPPTSQRGDELPQADQVRRCGSSVCHERGLD